MRRLNIVYCIFFSMLFSPLFSQEKENAISYVAEISGVGAISNAAPFWLQHRNYGIASSEAFSASALLGLYKNVDYSSPKFDYGFQLTGFALTNKQTTLFAPHQYSFQLHWQMFDLTIGAKAMQWGNQDNELSAGGLIFSSNARPMPRITLGIDEYYKMPITGGMIEIKGGLSHGWFNDNAPIENVLLHHKFAALRLGGHSPVRFEYELHHMAQWGGNIPGVGQQPVGFNNFLRIFAAQGGGSDAHESDQINTLGNHIISQQLKVTANFDQWHLGAYWQNISEDGPVRFITSTMNVADGLWGLSIKRDKKSVIQSFLYEYLNTTDQSGPYHDKDGIVYGGIDNYFMNGIYTSGWTYFGRMIGTPFVGNVNVDGFNIFNNRVQLHHFGLSGAVSKLNYKALYSHAKSYGNYSQPFPEAIKANYLMLDITRPNIVAGFDVALALSADIVPQANNNYGAMLRLTKTGSLFKTKNNKVKETINNEGKVDVKESPKKPKVNVDEKESPKKPKVKEKPVQL